MPTAIRPAASDDAAAMTAVFLASRAVTMPYLPRLSDDEETGAWVAGVVLAQCQVWVAEEVDESRIVGFVAVEGDQLEHLYLDPEHRRRGVGTQLLEQARLASPNTLTLRVFTRNTDARLLRAARLPPPRRERRRPQRGERTGHDLWLDRVRLMGAARALQLGMARVSFHLECGQRTR